MRPQIKIHQTPVTRRMDKVRDITDHLPLLKDAYSGVCVPEVVPVSSKDNVHIENCGIYQVREVG